MKKRSLLVLLFMCIMLVSAAPAAAGDCTKASYFYDTVWKSHNLGTGFISYHVLKSDGTSGYSESPGSDFIFDGTDTWKVENGFLILVWTNGFATEKYPLNGKDCTVLNGEKTSKKWKGTQPVRLKMVAID